MNLASNWCTTINKLEAQAIGTTFMFDAIDLNRFNGPTTNAFMTLKMIFSMQEKLDDVENIKTLLILFLKIVDILIYMNENDDIAKIKLIILKS